MPESSYGLVIGADNGKIEAPFNCLRNKRTVEEASIMSDRPKPGKDKDLRFIRQAIEETDKFYYLLSGGLAADQSPELVSFISEAMLLTIEQFDLLDQMLDDAAIAPIYVIEHNRCLRNLLRAMTQKKLSLVEQIGITRMIQAIGDQLKSLLIVKEIRSND